ncbi:MAG: hypothetical protein HOQ05_05030 [Corynebacteriales bacterium]|nr:hypothetical protein [Mycobacteriales bacterium]
MGVYSREPADGSPVTEQEPYIHPPRGYSGARRRGWRSSTVLVVIAIVTPQLLLAAALAAGVGVWPGSNSDSTANANIGDEPQNLALGDCVRANAAEEGSYLPVECQDHRVYGEVIDVVTGDTSATEACKPETDFFATQPHPDPAGAGVSSQVVCLKRTGDVHPGDPGSGGGIYRAGDCVATDSGPDTDVREVPCDDPAVFEKVTARVKTVAECTAPAERFATLSHGTDRVLCLGNGAGIASTGECMGDPTVSEVVFAEVTCGTPEASATVLGRTSTPAECQELPGQTHYVEDPNGLPASRTVCLQMR